jgi:hypothetical protein
VQDRTLTVQVETPRPRINQPEGYRKVWGEDPDSFQKQANPLTPTIAQGKRGSLLAGCLAHPSRIDFNLTPPSSQEAPQVSFPLIEDTGLLQTELSRIIDKIDQCGVLHSVIRVALSVQFLALQPSSAPAKGQ